MRGSGFILPAFGLLFFLAQELVSAAENGTTPDKSAFTLFNPVPQDLMRELAPDRPDATESPYTVDAGHLQLEMDFANFTYNTTGIGSVHAWNIAPVNIKLGLLNN